MVPPLAQRWRRLGRALPLAIAALLTGCSSPADPAVRDNPGFDLGYRPAVEREPPGPPPPISGGTLLVTRDAVHAVASDPDVDSIWIVGLAEDSSRRVELGLERGDEPGRLAEGSDNLVHVALRRGNALVTVNVRKGQVTSRRATCRSPRGVARDSAKEQLHVACATGELWTFDESSQEPQRRLRLEPDLRDVVVSGEKLLVSRFKSAEVLVVDAVGQVVERVAQPTFRPTKQPDVRFEPGVAWRMVPVRSGGAMLLHQRARATPIPTDPRRPDAPVSYLPGADSGDGCSALMMHATVTRIGDGLPPSPAPGIEAHLPVDLAIHPQTGRMAFISAAVRAIFSDVQLQHQSTSGDCQRPKQHIGPSDAALLTGVPIAIAFAPAVSAHSPELLVVQTRNPSQLIFPSPSASRRPIPLGDPLTQDLGHAMFHGATPSGLSCASCHPEGDEDGHVWNFPDMGGRRTQALGGGLTRTAPFHWDGSMPTLAHLMDDVLATRMGAGKPPPEHLAALESWMDTLPANSAIRDAADEAAARGKALFDDSAVGCASCHSGPRLTNNRTVAVGTGGRFQVPSLLGVAQRAPFMHDGCAATLRDALGACGGGDEHGRTSQLTAQQLDDLVAYLETL